MHRKEGEKDDLAIYSKKKMSATIGIDRISKRINVHSDRNGQADKGQSKNHTALS